MKCDREFLQTRKIGTCELVYLKREGKYGKLIINNFCAGTFIGIVLIALIKD